ncbi:uncharacterized protein LOC125179330 [Hyalella azteca]|uniref:RNA-directed DNA polymerase n=1 Tax=Hyalella azteca TaxID=294128 RepID=A0A979FX11_HYAAZ|nr:uncharacterized protein LOC125179330 [Hyalella azteca]
MDTAFETLKQKLAEEVTLAFPDYSEQADELELFVDASGTGAGACLMQKQQGNYKTIAYSSTTFSDTQCRYSTIERELEAIRWGIKTFRAFLFGVKFVLYTDHKPLLYLQNMSRENSRLMRTINELAEYDFTIRYRPGTQNEAADALSRLSHDRPTDKQHSRWANSSELPGNLKLAEKVDGGGNSLFVSLFILLKDLAINEETLILPEDHASLREHLVEHLLASPEKFKIKLDKLKRRQLKLMKNVGELPCEEIILAASDLYNVEIWVHHGMTSPVIYKSDNLTEDHQIMHLQCISGIHYNPVEERNLPANKMSKVNIKLKNINQPYTLETMKPSGKRTEVEEDSDEENKIKLAINIQIATCNHTSLEGRYSASIGEEAFCCIIDTGSQVSVISKDLWERIYKANTNLVFEEGQEKSLGGIGSNLTEILGIVKLKPKLMEIDIKEDTPFAVIETSAMPCCCILGANFLNRNNIILDFRSKSVYKGCGTQTDQSFLMNKHIRSKTGSEFLGHISTNDKNISSDSDHSTNYPEIDEVMPKIKYTISEEELKIIQNKDESLKELKEMITMNKDIKDWKLSTLNQYKRHKKNLRVHLDILVRDTGNTQSIVIPFALMVEVVHKTHLQLAHIGRHKLVDLVLRNFWHPALDKVARDICASCYHCQLFKTSRMIAIPPTLKIETSYPFELVAIDVMLLPKSSRNNIAVVVAVDHFSKWLVAVPLRDKKASTVTKAFTENILPTFAGIPDRVLSDNGVEFKSSEFNEVLENNNITHIYSTPYKASSNGCVERCNRSIIQLLKGLVQEKPRTWDLHLPKALMIHNHTVHSQLGMSPSQCILHTTHPSDKKLPIKNKVIETWKEGNPKFAPFSLGQLVLKKIQRKGHSLGHKLSERFEGPFRVVKVQSNELTYELQKENDNQEDKITYKAHYRQLKAFKTIPEYLKKYVSNECNDSKRMKRDHSSDTLAEGLGATYDFSSECSDTSTDDHNEGKLSVSPNRLESSSIVPIMFCT